jgi:hypothetical protein
LAVVRWWSLIACAACASAPVEAPDDGHGSSRGGGAPASLPTSEPAASAVDAAAPQPSSEPSAPALPPPLPKGTVVLHIGDSMADALGKPLNRELDKRGIKAYLEAHESTYIPEWAGFKMELDRHLLSRKPDLVLITLGGNEMKVPDPSTRVAAVQRIVQKVGDRPCLWIAAPMWPGLKSTGILDVIREHCAPCLYVDTNVLIPDLQRLKDGVHPTIPERRRWAQFMIRWMLHNRDPQGKQPWSFKALTSAPPPTSETWLESR